MLSSGNEGKANKKYKHFISLDDRLEREEKNLQIRLDVLAQKLNKMSMKFQQFFESMKIKADGTLSRSKQDEIPSTPIEIYFFVERTSKVPKLTGELFYWWILPNRWYNCVRFRLTLRESNQRRSMDFKIFSLWFSSNRINAKENEQSELSICHLTVINSHVDLDR